MTRELVIRSEQDLLPLVGAPAARTPWRRPRLLIRVAPMEEGEARAWEARLEGLRQQCGCTAGAVAMCAFVLCCVLFAAYSEPAAGAHPTVGELAFKGGLFIAGLILSAVGGKGLGLSMSRRRHRQTCLMLQQRLRELTACP